MPDKDIYTLMKPFRAALREHREHTLRVSSRMLSEDIGKGQTWITEMELGHRAENPGLIRLLRWAKAVKAEEFGLYIVLDGAYADFELLNPEGR